MMLDMMFGVSVLFGLIPLIVVVWVLAVLYRLVRAVEGIQGTLDYLVPRLVLGDGPPAEGGAPDG